MMEINKKIHNLLHTRLCSPTTLIRKYKNVAKANNFPFSVFGILGERLPENPEDIYCPACGYYCLGKGGFDCIDKPALVEQLKRRKQVDTDADQE